MTPSMIKNLWAIIFTCTIYLSYNLVQNKNKDTFNIVLKVVIIACNIFFLLDTIFTREFLG